MDSVIGSERTESKINRKIGGHINLRKWGRYTAKTPGDRLTDTAPHLRLSLGLFIDENRQPGRLAASSFPADDGHLVALDLLQ